MRRRVMLGVLLGLVGAFVAPTVALADDCSGLADCYGTVEGAFAALLGGGLIYGALAGFFSSRGRASKAGENSGEGGAGGAAQGGPEAPDTTRPSERGLRPGETTPPFRRETTLYPPDGGPTRHFTDQTTREGFHTHSEPKPDGSRSESKDWPDGRRMEVDRRENGSETQRHYGPDGQLVGTKEIAPDGSFTRTPVRLNQPDGSVVDTKTHHAPDGTLLSTETNTRDKEGNFSFRTTTPDGTTTEELWDSNGCLTSKTTTSGPSHVEPL